MKKLLAVIILLFSAVTSHAENFLELRIPCNVGKNVIAILPAGEVITLGRVLMLPAKTNYPAYTASKWCTPSTVCASAVNAVHILIDIENERGRIISLLPAVTTAPAAERGSFFALDIPAGSGLFGGFAPLVGSSVSVLHDGQESALVDVPSENDTVIIRSPLPENPEYFMLDIENRPGGRVIAYGHEGVKVIARAMRPVGGVGRFEGTYYQGRGRIRASHAGVIDVSTSRRGKIGGLQIMPLKHALTSPEMINAWRLTQWLIVAPLPGMPDLEGQPPMFKNAFVPGTGEGDRLPDIWSSYGRKPIVLCRRNGGNWEFMPEVSGRVDDGLRDVTHLRLYFPAWLEL